MRTIKARLHALEYLADGILGIELRPQSRADVMNGRRQSPAPTSTCIFPAA